MAVQAPDTVEVGETFAVRITAAGSDVTRLDVDPPAADGVSFQGRSSSTSISSSWIGGRRTTSRNAELALSYAAFAPGSVSLGPFVAFTGSGRHDLGSVSITVTGERPPGQGGARGSSSPEPISVETVVDRTGPVYTGMPVTVRYYLRTRYPLREIAPSWQSPRRGVARLVGTPEQLAWESDDAMFSRAHILTLQMIPACPGSIMVPRVSVDALAFAHGSPLGSSVTVRSDSSFVAVNPVPQEGRPEGFSGAVGRVDVTVDVGEPAGESCGRRLVISAGGPGAAGLDRPPPLTVEGPAELELVGSRGRGKSRSWTFLLSPREAGRVRIGPDSLPWLDPASGEFAWTRYGAGSLEVAAPAPTRNPVEPPARGGEDGADPVGLAAGLVVLAAAVSLILILRSRRSERRPSLAEAEDADELLSAMESRLGGLLADGNYLDGRELRRLMSLRGVDGVTARSVMACWRRAEALASGSGRHMLGRVREDAVNAIARLEEILQRRGPSES